MALSVRLHALPSRSPQMGAGVTWRTFPCEGPWARSPPAQVIGSRSFDKLQTFSKRAVAFRDPRYNLVLRRVGAGAGPAGGVDSGDRRVVYVRESGCSGGRCPAFGEYRYDDQ